MWPQATLVRGKCCHHYATPPWATLAMDILKDSDPWVPHLNRLSFAKVNTVVAPPNEWPTTATLLKSNLPLNEKKMLQQQSDFFYTDWLKKKFMADEGADNGTDNDDDTICDFPRYSCNLTRKRPQINCVETTRHSTWMSFQHFYSISMVKMVWKIVVHFYTVIERET